MRRYSLMRTISTLSLGPRRSLALVEVSGQWFLVGVGSENISLISRIEKPADSGQFENKLHKGGNIFDSFLSKAGLTAKAPEEGIDNNEQHD